MLDDIRELAQTALQDADAFYNRLSNRLEERYNADEDALKSELDVLAKRSGEIDALFLNLYQDKSKGILTEQRFMKMTEALEQEQAAGKARTQEIMNTLRAASGKNENVRRFISEIRECATITELDEAILNRLIDRITIGEVQTVDGEKIQQVKIKYNFVGEIPG